VDAQEGGEQGYLYEFEIGGLKTNVWVVVNMWKRKFTFKYIKKQKTLH